MDAISLDWILVGAAMACKDQRARIFAMDDAGFERLSRELLTTARDSAPTLKTWLRDKGLVLEDGEKLVDACIRIIEQRAVKARQKETVGRLHAASCLSRADIYEQALREALERIEKRKAVAGRIGEQTKTG